MIRYNQVTDDLSKLPAFIAYYERELEDAKQECKIYGNLEKAIRELPGHTEHRFNQLQEIESVLEFMNIELRKIRKKHYQKYLEKYARALSSRDAQTYADAEDEVIDYEILMNEVALLRNKYLGVIKGIETKQWQLGHITKLRTAGMEDVVI